MTEFENKSLQFAIEEIRKDARRAALEEAAKVAANYDPNRDWSADDELQNIGNYAAGEASSEIEAGIRALMQ